MTCDVATGPEILRVHPCWSISSTGRRWCFSRRPAPNVEPDFHLWTSDRDELVALIRVHVWPYDRTALVAIIAWPPTHAEWRRQHAAPAAAPAA